MSVPCVRFAGLYIQPAIPRSACTVGVGCPIRTSPDQSLFDNSPELIAAYHVLHRLITPRHPPCTLNSLITFVVGPQPDRADESQAALALLFRTLQLLVHSISMKFSNRLRTTHADPSGTRVSHLCSSNHHRWRIGICITLPTPHQVFYRP